MITLLAMFLCVKYKVEELNLVGFMIIDIAGIMVTGIVLLKLFG